jgi:DNA-binding XRE family transcriptional regulator
MRDFSHTRLRSLRVERGISRKDLAHTCGVSYFTVRNVETGERKPNLRVLATMADMLGVTIDGLFENVNA